MGVNVSPLRAWLTSTDQCGLSAEYHLPLLLALDFHGMQFFWTLLRNDTLAFQEGGYFDLTSYARERREHRKV